MGQGSRNGWDGNEGQLHMRADCTIYVFLHQMEFRLDISRHALIMIIKSLDIIHEILNLAPVSCPPMIPNPVYLHRMKCPTPLNAVL